MTTWTTRIITLWFDSSAIGAAEASALYAGVRSVDVPTELVGGRFRAGDGIAKRLVHNERSLIWLGSAGGFGEMLLDPDTGRVVHADQEFADVVPVPVNSTLERFTKTVSAVNACFPFYGSDANLDQRTSVANKVRAAIGQIDPTVVVDDSFWVTFVDDIAIGDFATEDIDPQIA